MPSGMDFDVSVYYFDVPWCSMFKNMPILSWNWCIETVAKLNSCYKTQYLILYLSISPSNR